MKNEKHHSLVRTIYLYLFALVGLALLTIGAVRFVAMGLKAFVFTKADMSSVMLIHCICSFILYLVPYVCQVNSHQMLKFDRSGRNQAIQEFI